MSAHDHRKFDPECPGCQPAILDPLTNEVLPPDHPAMVSALKIWKGLTRKDQEAFHRFTVLNGRDLEALRVMEAFGKAFEEAEEPS